MPAVKRSDGRPKLTRAESARATDWRIIGAAYELFVAQGYPPTTMAQIAAAAGVAVQTIYFKFHTKAVLLSRAYAFAVMGEREPLPPESQAWYAAMVAEPDLDAAIRQLVTGVGEITRRVVPVELAARVAAAVDPEAGRVMEFQQRWRADGYRGMLEILCSKGRLRSGLTEQRASDLLLLLVSADTYRVLVGLRGWTHEDWVAWVVRVLRQELFET
jgi:AcrR family transcriptional regulator